MLLVDEIENKIIAIVADQIGIDSELIEPSSLFSDELGADSLDVIEIVMQIETHFAIHIPDEQAVKINNIKSAANVVRQLI